MDSVTEGITLSEEELRRYSRQTALGEIGRAGQERLKSGSVLIVGCGALGSMAAMQLAGAGVGRIGIADFDTVDVSNLQRQFFFSTEEAGKLKSEILEREMKRLNPFCAVERNDFLVTAEKAKTLVSRYDFIIDATDNASSKSLVEESCGNAGRPCCVAGVAGFHGQVMTVFPGGEKFSSLFSGEEEGGMLPCSIGGVVGPAAALCASVQAAEAIKFLTGAGECMGSRLLTFNLLSDTFRLFHI